MSDKLLAEVERVVALFADCGQPHTYPTDDALNAAENLFTPEKSAELLARLRDA